MEANKGKDGLPEYTKLIFIGYLSVGHINVFPRPYKSTIRERQ